MENHTNNVAILKSGSNVKDRDLIDRTDIDIYPLLLVQFQSKC